MYKKIYDGEKVYLSKMRVEDVDTYVKWMNDENVTRGLIGGVQTVTREDEEGWIRANIDANQFAIVRKKDNGRYEMVSGHRRFEKLGLHVITLTVYAFNERAIACYKKVGFKECGRCREACFIDEKRYDKIMMDILREEAT